MSFYVVSMKFNHKHSCKSGRTQLCVFLYHMDVTSQWQHKIVANINILLFCCPLQSGLKWNTLSFFAGFTVYKQVILERGISRNFIWYDMNRLMNALPTMIYFITVVFLTSIRAQILYETDYQQYSLLNKKVRKFLFNIYLARRRLSLRKRRLIYKNLSILRKKHTMIYWWYTAKEKFLMVRNWYFLELSY